MNIETRAEVAMIGINKLLRGSMLAEKPEGGGDGTAKPEPPGDARTAALGDACAPPPSGVGHGIMAAELGREVCPYAAQ